MRHWKAIMVVVAMAGALALGAAAQIMGRISGKVIDQDGKPWAGVTVVISNPDTGAKFTIKTNSKGEYLQMGLSPGIFTITFETAKYSPQVYKVQVQAGGHVVQDLNFQKLLAANPEYQKALAKQKAEKAEFAKLSQHFNAGRKAIDQINALKQQMYTQPAAQREQTQQQITQLGQTAVTELSEAEKIAGPTNSNLPTIIGNLALAYEAAGQHQQAADTFEKAAQMVPTDPGYLLGAATNLAYLGKIDQAGADCDKVMTTSAPQGATCWRNLGVVLYNTNKLKEAVSPLQKAVKADPTNADTWYLLGSALMNTMQSKMVNGKLTAVVAPGTVEAYQKYLSIAPNGPRAAEAKQALQVLQQLGAGVDTKYIKKH